MKIRLQEFKSFRHYGGREITTYNHLVEAEFITQQRDGSYLCILKEDGAGFKAGHKISVIAKDFDVK